MKKLLLILSLMFLSSAVFAGYVQTYKISYDSTTEKAVFTFVDTIQVGTSTDTADVYIILYGSGTIETVELNVTQITWGDGTVQTSSPPAGGAAVSGDVWKSPSTGVPGDAYVSTGFEYFEIGYTMTLTSATATVTSDGITPQGEDGTTFDIKVTTGVPGTDAFVSVFNSTTALQLTPGTTYVHTVDFKDATYNAGDIFRIDCTETSTTPGGSPWMVTLYGKQD